MKVMEVYNTLLKHHGPQNWWPCRTGKKFEVCIGAILTQNTSWGNVEKALDNLVKMNCVDAAKIAEMDARSIERLVKPSGFFRQKARRLKGFSRFVLDFGSMKKFLRNVTREQLLSVNGIGPETADSILLYACGRPYFVVDAYTKRMFSALGIVGGEDYEQTRSFFESGIPRDAELYKEFHALIVRHAKECCRGFLKSDCVLNGLKHTQDKQSKRVSRQQVERNACHRAYHVNGL